MGTKSKEAWPPAEAETRHWCIVCGTDHLPRERCPGEVQATGEERRGWKVNVQTLRGIEAFGVLLAPAGHRWRARVLTFPRMLWLAPGSGGTIKFLGRTAEEAERKAIEFVRDHCRARGYVMRDEIAALDTAAPGHSGIARPLREAEHPRYHRSLPVRFGENKPILRGTTADLSESGLFVVTDTPAVESKLVGILLHLEHCTVPLRGSVVWLRRVPAAGRPPGMGVRLHQPPGVYVNYVRALGA